MSAPPTKSETASSGSTRESYESESFLPRLVKAHGWRYVLLIVCVYGINQGAGEGLLFFAEQYWLTDPSPDNSPANYTGPLGLGLSPSRYAEIGAVTNIPWQIKALYGVASDAIPIFGLHKTPYMILASIAGVLSSLLLWTSPIAWTVPGSAMLLLLANLAIASPDVMIDGSIAERSSEVPMYAADLQSLCWMSFGIFQILSMLVAPRMLETLGTRSLFGAATFTALAVTIPTSLGWMGEKRDIPVVESEAVYGSCFRRVKRFMDDPGAGPFVRLAMMVTGISLTMGIISMKNGTHHAFISGFAMFVVTPLTAFLVYRYESMVDRDLAKFSLYIFLTGAIQPSTPVLFYWMKQDEYNCSKNLPCFSPSFIATLSIVGQVMFVIGTWVYNRFLTRISYKSIYMTTQFAMFLLNIVDLFWVNRLNIAIGLSDEAFVLGDEVIAPMISRWNTMPMMVLSAVLCPPNVFATFFALNMGLSNFGGTLGGYFGVGLMVIFGVDTHKYDRLPEFVVARSLFRLLPMCLIPFLLPNGSPSDPPTRQWSAVPSNDVDDEDVTEAPPPIPRTYTVVPAQDVVAANEMVSLTTA